MNFKGKNTQFYAQITPKFFQIKLTQKKLTLKNALIWNIFNIKNEHFKQKTVQNVHLAAPVRLELTTHGLTVRCSTD